MGRATSAAFILATALSAGVLAFAAFGPCPTEDAAGPCYWNGKTMGNRDGDSFFAIPGIGIVYLNHKES